MTDPRRSGLREGRSPAEAPPAPLSLRTWPRVAAPIAVLLLGIAGAWGVARDDLYDADMREELVADQTANLVTATIQQLVAAISGVSGLPDDTGEIDQRTFEAYALGAADESPFTALAYATVVPAAERETFEEATGQPIIDTPGGAASADRPSYLPVRWVAPMTDATERLVGYDLATDPTRRQAAEHSRDLGTAVITETIAALPDGDPAVFVVHPVYRAGTPRDATVTERREAILGYVSASVHGDALLDAVDTQVTDPIGIRIEDPPGEDSGSPLVLAETDPAPGRSAVDVRSVGGRQWQITVDDRQPLTSEGPWLILAGTAALTLALAVLGWRVIRHERDVDLHIAMVERIADLGRTLAAAGSVDDLRRAVSAEVPRVLDADAARFHELDEPSDAPADAMPSLPGATVAHRINDDQGITVATLEVAWPPGPEPQGLTLASLATVTEMCGQALVRARLSDRVRRDAVTSRLLAGLAEASTTAGTTDRVARTLVDRAADVPAAASAQIGLPSEDGISLRIVHERSVTGAAPVTEVPLDRSWPIVAAYDRACTVLLGDLDAATAAYPAVVDTMRSTGIVAMACLPLIREDGRPLGALELGWSQPQRFDADLLGVLRTTAELCASSLERAQATDQAQARSAALATLAAHLSAASSFEDVGAAIVAHATPVLGADSALLGVIEGDRLRLLTSAGDAPGESSASTRPNTDLDLSLEGDFPALLALERSEVVTFSTLSVPDPALAGELERAGLRGGAAAPLVSADGETSGVFVALWADPPEFDQALLARISTVADLCSQSAERSLLFDAEHRVRQDLQHTVVSRTPTVAGLDVATRYRPAASSVGMGGDWYDAITVEGGGLCLVVGDVSGHGVGAIAEMTQLRTVLHTLVAGGMPLSEILVHTSALMQRDGLGYATVLLAVIDPREGILSYVTAGHPPGLVRRPDGTVDTLTGGRHSVLGIDLLPKLVGHAPFPPGSTLVMYTDGLIERRDTVIDASVAALASALAATGEVTADGLADHLLDGGGVAGDAGVDDVALVVARRTA